MKAPAVTRPGLIARRTSQSLRFLANARRGGAAVAKRLRRRPRNDLGVQGATRGDLRARRLILGYFRHGVEVGPGMTVIDVGAHIGLFSLEVLRRCRGDVRLLAFEPAPDPFAALERNVRELFPGTPAHLDRRALSDRCGAATLHYRPRASGTSSLYARDGGDSKAFIDGMLQEPPAEYREVFPR